MKFHFFLIAFALAITLVLNCQRLPELKEAKQFPHLVEAKGIMVHKDSLTPPEIIPVDQVSVTRIPVSALKTTLVQKKFHKAGQPRIVKAGKPRVVVPGKDGNPTPKTVPAIDKPFLASTPGIVEANNPKSKDENPNNFIIYGKLQGLNMGRRSSLMEDRKGNIWISSPRNGVTKFDGRFFTNYTTDEGLSSNDILSMFEDSRGHLWFGTNAGGVTKYDGTFFTHYSTAEGLIDWNGYSILEDRGGNIWFGSWGGGVSKYDGHTFTHYFTDQGLPESGMAMLEDSKGNLWFGTGNGMLIKFDGNSFEQFTTEEGMPGDLILTLKEDHEQNIWIGTSGSGVVKYDGTHFYQYTLKEGLSGLKVSTIMEDRNGNLWFGTENGGITRYDGEYFYYFDQESGLTNNTISSLLQDKSGNIWIGTDGALAKYSGDAFTHYSTREGLPSESVSSILKDSKGKIWFGTKEGITGYDGENFSTFPSFENLHAPIVNTIVQDHDHNLWFSLYGEGLAKYDGEVLTYFSSSEGFLNGYIDNLFVDSRNNLWLGMNGAGLVKYDGRSFAWYYKGRSGLSDPDITSIVEDNENRIWLGTYGGGLTILEGANFLHFTTANGLISNTISSLLKDHNGNIWVGTSDRGFCQCTLDPADTLLRCMTISKKLGFLDDCINSMIEDSAHNILFGTPSGLSVLAAENIAKLKPNSKEITDNDFEKLFKKYTYWDGFLGFGVNRGQSMCEADNGTIWIGTNDRVTAYNPNSKSLVKDTMAPNIQLAGLDVFNEKVNWLHFAKNKKHVTALQNGIQVRHVHFDSLSPWYSVPENLQLPYTSNYLTFKYIGITHHQPQKVKYQYILEGNDDDWSAPTTSTEAHYGNLPHGSYTFKVKAVNGEGYWSKELNYHLTIRPPWWLTWWAYGLYTLGIITLLWRLHKYQQARTIRIERERTQEKELEQAKEIEKAYAELKATQKQLIQSEKMASLGQVTAGIAHEIQNPLNFVNNFSEVSNELLDDMKKELTAGHKQQAIEIAEDVKENLEKILHHGKRADAIVKSMLEHSRTSSGVKEPTDINALCDEYLRLAYHGLRAKDKSFNATMKTEFDESIGMINVIPQDIGRVILNLITNAFYAVSEKAKSAPLPPIGGKNYEPMVTVKTNLVKPPLGGLGANIIEISVSDNGPGIPPSALDKIFQPFFTTKPTGQGTGLGLSLSYDIVKAHGGELKVETKEGEGTEFIIILPDTNK